MSLMLRRLCKSHDGITQALDDISLDVADGAFLAVLGPSGSGKTTLLRVIAGLDAPDAGQIVVDGHDMACVPARLRGAGMVFQHYALFRHMSVADNIAFGLSVRPRATRPSRPAIRDRVRELLDLVQMPGLGARYPDQLSGGQRQRVALARALAIEPRLLLLDEPFGALDARVRRDLRRWLRDLHDRLRLTTILVTHDQTEALELADQVAVLRAGGLEQIDTPARLHDQPATEFVHEFLGDTVRLPCVVAAGQAVFADAIAAAPIPTQCPEGPATALIRPQQIRLLPVDAGAPSATVIAVRLAGGIHRAEVDLGGFHADVILRPDETDFSLGSRCRLDVRAARVYASPCVIKP